MEGSFKGILYPARLPTFHRFPAPASVADLVQWFWIPEWDIEPGRIVPATRHRLPCLQPGGAGHADVVFSGPTTRAAYRDLTGQGWAVGALLRPAAVPLFTDDPGACGTQETELALAELHAAVSAAMTRTAERNASSRHTHDDGAHRSGQWRPLLRGWFPWTLCSPRRPSSRTG